MEALKLKGVAHEGKLTLSAPQLLRDWLSLLKGRGPVAVALTIRESFGRRSPEANGLWEALVRRYSIDAGHVFDELRMELKIRHGVSFDWSPSLPKEVFLNRPGVFVQRGTGYLFVISTADYNTREFKTLIDGTIAECGEAGVNVEDILNERT